MSAEVGWRVFEHSIAVGRILLDHCSLLRIDYSYFAGVFEILVNDTTVQIGVAKFRLAAKIDSCNTFSVWGSTPTAFSFPALAKPLAVKFHVIDEGGA